MSTDEVGAHCPACLSEYRPGFDTCADDGTPLVRGPAPSIPESPPARVTPTGPPPRWTQVAQFRDPDEARLLCGRLQAEDIDARIFPEDVGSYPYGRGASLGQLVQVLVPEDQVKAAEYVIRHIERG
jgi:hypothetical protein